MSRIGKKPVTVPDGVKVKIDPVKRHVLVEGPKGKLEMTYRAEVSVNWDEQEKQIVCTIDSDLLRHGQTKAYWGMTRSLIQNMVQGVTEGFRKDLELIGVGWNARLQGANLQLNVGYCHPIDMPIPKGLEVQVEGNNKISIAGVDKQQVGQFAAEVRSKRPPEPYKGKGLRYVGEYVIRKQGKAFGS